MNSSMRSFHDSLPSGSILSFLLRRVLPHESRLIGTLTVVLTLLLALPAAAQAARLKLGVTYTNGQILSGPLSADLTDLPDSVYASFTLKAVRGGVFGLEDVVESSLVFGDGAWNVGDLQSFSTTIMPADAGLAVASLTYAYRAIDTPTADGKLAANFPLEIEGTDLATGQAFLYRYDASSETLTVVPEPMSVALAALGFLGVLAFALRHRWAQHP